MGWSFSLRIPGWHNAQLPDGESTVFYQVEVTVIAPDGSPRVRSIGRRFSNFLSLHNRLKEELGPQVLTGLDPPPKRALAGVNTHPPMIEQRRKELEKWLWKLMKRESIANSIMLAHFCELDSIRRTKPSSIVGDTDSEVLKHASSSPSRDVFFDTAHSLSGTSTPGSGSIIGGDPLPQKKSHPRPALHLESRRELQSLLSGIKQRLEGAYRDIEDASLTFEANEKGLQLMALEAEQLKSKGNWNASSSADVQEEQQLLKRTIEKVKRLEQHIDSLEGQLIRKDAYISELEKGGASR